MVKQFSQMQKMIGKISGKGGLSQSSLKNLNFN
jgi:hypothetical protein